MKLAVHVGREHVATLERADAFRHVLTYRPGVDKEHFVSLTMPVRTESWVWPQGLHPFFQQNLPEGYLLSILREQAGGLLDGTDLSLLALVGRNVIGCVRVAPEGADPFELPQVLEVKDVLKGDNSEEHFAELVRKYAISGVSGVVPKFLSSAPAAAEASRGFHKATLRLTRHIVKGSTARLPYVALNEHLTMEVARKAGLRVAETRLSDDGKALVVTRFDVDATGEPVLGVEDLCSLLGLKPEEKYATTWERMVHAADTYLPPESKHTEREELAKHLLTTLVLRDADCHSKNIALTYRNLGDVAFAPVYDMVTVTAYPDFATSDPALKLAGRNSWAPGKSLEHFLQVRLGVPPRRQKEMVEALCDAAVAVSKEVVRYTKAYSAFRDIGKNMLHAWNEGMAAVRDPRRPVEAKKLTKTIEKAGFSGPTRATSKGRSGRSPLLGKRGAM